MGFSMVAILIFELLCLASLVFMIQFLIVLSRDGITKSRCRVVYLTSRPPEPEDDSYRLATSFGGARSSNANSRPPFKVIAGRRKRPFRRVG